MSSSGSGHQSHTTYTLEVSGMLPAAPPPSRAEPFTHLSPLEMTLPYAPDLLIARLNTVVLTTANGPPGPVSPADSLSELSDIVLPSPIESAPDPESLQLSNLPASSDIDWLHRQLENVNFADPDNAVSLLAPEIARYAAQRVHDLEVENEHLLQRVNDLSAIIRRQNRVIDKNDKDFYEYLRVSAENVSVSNELIESLRKENSALTDSVEDLKQRIDEVNRNYVRLADCESADTEAPETQIKDLEANRSNEDEIQLHT